MDECPDVLFGTETSVPKVTGYTVEWKEASETWDDAQSTTIASLNTRRGTRSLTNGVEYSARIYAHNQYGESPPSPEVTGTSREMKPPRLLEATVDGSTLTVTYSETLDGASIPGLDTFKISVDGSDRVVQRVSIDGSQVTLTLASDVAAGDGVMLISS